MTTNEEATPMEISNSYLYLSEIVEQLKQHWPTNRTINIVCHGHSVPAGYTATPIVDTFNAYPHLLHVKIKERFPFAVVNVIVTAIGGENAVEGEQRFDDEVLNHHPDVITIDYALNDRGIGLVQAKAVWMSMIEKSIAAGSKVILLTPTWDITGLDNQEEVSWVALKAHAAQIRSLAQKYSVGLVDSFSTFENYHSTVGDITDLLSWTNHPNRRGHELVAQKLLRWFPYTK
jgi:acyl-CoA thioesterase-1